MRNPSDNWEELRQKVLGLGDTSVRKTHYPSLKQRLAELEQLTEDLKRSQAYLAEAQTLSHTGSFGWKVATGEHFWSEETYRIFEFDRAVKPTLDLILERTHPEDRTLVIETLERASEGGRDFDFEHRLLMPDGRVKYLHVLVKAIQDSSGAIEFVGAVMDVTAVKQANESLRQSEAELRQLIDAIPQQVFVFGPDWSPLFASRREREYTGLSLEESQSKDAVARVFHPEDLKKLEVARERALSDGMPIEMEARIRRKDGQYRWFLIRDNPLRDEQGRILRWYGTRTDIEDRKRAEEMLRQSEAELQQILDGAPQHVAVLDTGGGRLFLNQAALDYHGLTLEEWQTSYKMGLFHPDDWERVYSEVQNAFSTGSEIEFEARTPRHDGVYRWFLFRYRPLRDEQGRITRWVVASSDIDDRKQAEERLQHENVALREEIDKASMFEEIVGSSPALRTVLSRVAKVAPTDSTVLVTGETGTGKELIARAIHKRSLRFSRAFVSVNCSVIPRDLIASELFGHEKGAFTGATHRHLGRFELAEGGTIFLDEIGELPAETQVALLRVLQEREFERVGGNRTIRCEVRVIAATNWDIQAAVAAGTFRSDLFYRLNVFPIEMPPLRKRKEDIPLLVEYFIDRYARKAGKNIRQVSRRSLELLQSYPWPGNIRELQNIIERSVIVCETASFSVDESWLTSQPPCNRA
jgi:formate hydrogenlyase transcriptional activator